MDENRLKGQKLPILFIVPQLIRAGAETQVLNLANLLNCGRFEKHLFTYLNKNDQYDRLNRNEVTFYNHIRQNKYDINVIKTVSNIIDQKRNRDHSLYHAAFFAGRLVSSTICKKKTKNHCSHSHYSK